MYLIKKQVYFIDSFNYWNIESEVLQIVYSSKNEERRVNIIGYGKVNNEFIKETKIWFFKDGISTNDSSKCIIK